MLAKNLSVRCTKEKKMFIYKTSFYEATEIYSFTKESTKIVVIVIKFYL